MTASSLPVLTYVLLLLAAVLLPFVSSWLASRAESNALAILLAGGAIILTIIRHGLMVEGAILLIVCALGHGLRSIAGATCAALLFATSTWWLAELDIASWQYPLAAATCLFAAHWARKCNFEPASAQTLSRRETVIAVAALLVVSIAAGLLTGPTNQIKAGQMAWHHWSVYVSPVWSMQAGGVPFRDFPVQYGMGPTLTIAAACAGNCWNGLYWLTLFANALFLAVCGWTALVLTQNMGRGARLMALTALAFAIYLWGGYPCDWAGIIMTPSVGGLRFLPMAALTALIVTLELRHEGAMRRPGAVAGFALWFLGLAWSPEAGFFATLIWWPWLALRRADKAPSRADALQALVLGGAAGLAATLGAYAALALAFRGVFGTWVSAQEFLLYLLHPPGRLPINFYGPVWFILAALLLGGVALQRCDKGPARRALFVCLLMAIATASYFVSRSFDNNVFNVLPALILLLLAAQAASPSQLGGGFLRASLAAIIGLAASMHFPAWTASAGSPSVAGLQIGPAALTARFAPSPADIAPIVPADAAALYTQLRRESREAVLLFDGKMVMPTSDPAAAWTVVNNSANYIPLPDEVTRHYVTKGAALFNKPGWLILANSDAAHWLSLFDAGYQIRESLRLGTYTAYRLEPRDAR